MLTVFALGAVGSVLGQPAPADYLIYSPLLIGTSFPDLLTGLGKTYTAVDDATWSAMTADDFKQYRAIVLPDPQCSSVDRISVPEANRAVWSQAIDGNVIVMGTDEFYHWGQGGSGLAEKALLFAGGIAGKTGLYVSLSCYYHGVAAGTPVPILDVFTTTSAFTAVMVDGCYNNVHIVATDSALSGLTDAMLSDWSCSIHNAFDSFPPEFIPLAIANTGTGMAFADGSAGIPYILARGEALSPVLCGDGVLQSTEECDDSNTVAGDGCSEKCKTEFCGDGIVNNNGVEQCDLGSGNGVGSGCVACLLEPVCGNGLLETGEQCDDGNVADGDGCSSACLIENHAPDCSAAYLYTPTELWPADGRFEHFAIRGITDVDGDDVFITVTSITQNQETKVTRDDKNCPDASVTALTLRVETNGSSTGGSRDGGKDGKSGSKGSQRGPSDKNEQQGGRIYKIAFTADDGNGGTCTGVVTACVAPPKCTCKMSADDIFYDSTKC